MTLWASFPNMICHSSAGLPHQVRRAVVIKSGVVVAQQTGALNDVLCAFSQPHLGATSALCLLEGFIGPVRVVSPLTSTSIIELC